MAETWTDQLSRLAGMARGEPTWDLSPNDRRAIEAALSRLAAAEQVIGVARDTLADRHRYMTQGPCAAVPIANAVAHYDAKYGTGRPQHE